MNSETTTHTGSGPSTLTIVTCWDDLRYLIMRTLRFVTMFGCQVTLVASFWFGLRSFGFGLIKFMSSRPLEIMEPEASMWYWRMAFANPWLCVILAMAAFAGCFALWFAVGVPYSYQTGAPGVNARLCGRCETVIPDSVVCQKCGQFRVQWFVTKLLWVLGAVVTVAHFVNDATIMVVGFLLARNNK